MSTDWSVCNEGFSQKVTDFFCLYWYTADPAWCHEGVPSLHEQPDENRSVGWQHRALNGRQSPSKAVGHGHGGGGHTAAALPSTHPAGRGQTQTRWMYSNLFGTQTLNTHLKHGFWTVGNLFFLLAQLGRWQRGSTRSTALFRGASDRLWNIPAGERPLHVPVAGTCERARLHPEPV